MFGTYFCYLDVLFLMSKGTVSLDELGIVYLGGLSNSGKSDNYGGKNFTCHFTRLFQLTHTVKVGDFWIPQSSSDFSMTCANSKREKLVVFSLCLASSVNENWETLRRS